MKRFLISFAIVAVVMVISAGVARADRGRRHVHVYTSVGTSYYVPTSYAVPTVVAAPTYVAPTVIAPTFVTPAVIAPTYVAPVVTPVVATSYVPTVQTTVYRVGRRRR
jgi:hypothetical protein